MSDVLRLAHDKVTAKSIEQVLLVLVGYPPPSVFSTCSLHILQLPRAGQRSSRPLHARLVSLQGVLYCCPTLLRVEKPCPVQKLLWTLLTRIRMSVGTLGPREELAVPQCHFRATVLPVALLSDLWSR